MTIDHRNWTRYHIIKTKRKWKFFKEGSKRSIVTADRQTCITEALDYVCFHGGYLCIHKPDATVDFIVSNWCG